MDSQSGRGPLWAAAARTPQAWRPILFDSAPADRRRTHSTNTNTNMTQQQYNNHLSYISFVVHNMLYPEHLSLLDVRCLFLISKKLRRRLDERKEITEVISAKLGLPKTRLYSIKLTTMFKARTSLLARYTNNPVVAYLSADCLRNWMSSAQLKMGHCCAVCLHHNYNDQTDRWNKEGGASVRAIAIGKHVQYDMICMNCMKTL
jgi:hypothetical protein